MSCVVKRSYEAELPSPLHTKRCRPFAAPDPALLAPLSPLNFAFSAEPFRNASESPFSFKQPSPLAVAAAAAAAAAAVAAATEAPAADGENSPFSSVRRKKELFPQGPVHRPVAICGDCGAVTERSLEDAVPLEEGRFRVDKAVRDVEMKLAREYDALLQAKLQEQFYIYSKFNQDHIHRQAPSQAYSYMS